MTALLAVFLVLIGLATAFVMAAKPSYGPLQKTYCEEGFFLMGGEYRLVQMGAFAIDLASTSGFLVADRNGEVVGRVECPMYGTAPDEPDALAVKAGLFSRRLVTADTIDSIDGANGVIGLRVERESIPTFL